MRSSTSTTTMLTKLHEINSEAPVADETDASIEPIWHYIEFQTSVMKIFAKSKKNHMLRKNCAEIYHSGLFTQRDDGKWYAHIDWPHAGNIKTITICANYSHAQDEYKFEFSFLGVNFLIIRSSGSDQLVIEKIPNPHKKMLLDALEIENILQTMLVFLNPTFVDYLPDSIVPQPLALDLHSNHFNQEQFAKLMTHYKQYDFTYRVHGVLNHTLKRNNAYLFYLDWEGQGAPAQLKVKFSFAHPFHSATPSTPGYSWVMPESTLLALPCYKPYRIQTGQLYYKVEVFEGAFAQASKEDKTALKKEDTINILNFWCTADGDYGELRDVRQGNKMSGNEVLKLFNYLNLLVRIANIFICDESALTGEKEEKFFLRLILALAVGKTWYEAKLPGLELLVSDDFVTPSGVLRQDKQKRSQALTELQQLSLNTLYTVLNETDQEELLKLCKQHLPNTVKRTRRSPRLPKLAVAYERNQLFSADAKLQELVLAVYNDSRSRHTVTDSLCRLNALLCRGINEIKLDEPLETEMSRKWVASRSEQLLSGSIFWIKQAQPKSGKSESVQDDDRKVHTL